MTSLVWPLLCFAAIVWLVWLGSPLRTRKTTYTGSLGDLDLLLGVVSTAQLGENRIDIKVDRRVPYATLVFEDDVLRLELPLLTARQRKQKESLLALAQTFSADACILQGKKDTERINLPLGAVTDPSAERIQKALLALLDFTPSRRLKFTVYLTSVDLHTIDEHYQADRSQTQSRAVAESADLDREQFQRTNRGCLIEIARLFVWPTVLLSTYLSLGLTAAMIALIGLWILARLTLPVKTQGPKRLWPFRYLLVSIALGAALITMVSGQTVYLQLALTIQTALVALLLILSLALGDPSLVVDDAEWVDSLGGKFRSLCVYLTMISLGAALTNEYLRRNLDFETWFWIFAFWRVEFLIALSFVAIPLIYADTNRETSQPKTPKGGDEA